jgi:hypothetical protein
MYPVIVINYKVNFLIMKSIDLPLKLWGKQETKDNVKETKNMCILNYL